MSTKNIDQYIAQELQSITNTLINEKKIPLSCVRFIKENPSTLSDFLHKMTMFSIPVIEKWIQEKM